jgi:2-keto-4-pentenoate hydratase/2-oxohepta-3-ene-1,7-dioic acid hydratase in catechol pathway
MRCLLVAGLCVLTLAGSLLAEGKKATKYVRFQAGDTIAYGIVEGDQVRQLSGNLFGKWTKTDKTFALDQVKLLAPAKPTQILAMAGNYRSHLPGEEVPPKFQIPQLFFKSPSCIVATGDDIVLPKGSQDVHYEGEMVIVIGKLAKNVTKEQALNYVLGVTCGNDVSARDWQKSDVQWWRAKGSDTFGPIGPVISSGIDYDNLLVQLRLNGKTMQKQGTKDLIHNVPTMVSFISQHITLHPGDLIFTGTSGKTTAIKPGDVVEVEIEGVGTLKNSVIAAK